MEKRKKFEKPGEKPSTLKASLVFVLLAACAQLAHVHTVHTCVTLHLSQRQAEQMDCRAPLPETLLRWSCDASRKLLTNSIWGQECFLRLHWGAWERAGLSARSMLSQHQCARRGFPSLLHVVEGEIAGVSCFSHTHGRASVFSESVWVSAALYYRLYSRAVALTPSYPSSAFQSAPFPLILSDAAHFCSSDGETLSLLSSTQVSAVSSAQLLPPSTPKRATPQHAESPSCHALHSNWLSSPDAWPPEHTAGLHEIHSDGALHSWKLSEGL